VQRLDQFHLPVAVDAFHRFHHVVIIPQIRRRGLTYYSEAGFSSPICRWPHYVLTASCEAAVRARSLKIAVCLI
jgi:hypothetical protein